MSVDRWSMEATWGGWPTNAGGGTCRVPHCRGCGAVWGAAARPPRRRWAEGRSLAIDRKPIRSNSIGSRVVQPSQCARNKPRRSPCAASVLRSVTSFRHVDRPDARRFIELFAVSHRSGAPPTIPDVTSTIFGREAFLALLENEGGCRTCSGTRAPPSFRSWPRCPTDRRSRASWRCRRRWWWRWRTARVSPFPRT